MDCPTSFHYNFNFWFLLASGLVVLYLQLARLYPSLVFFQALGARSLIWTYISHLSLVLPQSLSGLLFGLLNMLLGSWFPPRKSGSILCIDHDIKSTSLFFSQIAFFILIVKCHFVYILPT